MANYYLNDDGTTSLKPQKRGKNYIQQNDGNTIENKIELPKPQKKEEEKKRKKSFLQKTADLGIGTLKTAGNIATNMGEGALRAGEGILDASHYLSDKIINSVSEKAEVLTGVSSKKKAKERREKRDKASQKFIKRDLTNEFQNLVGYNDDVRKEFEKGSLVKKDNLGGQISQGIGGMVPSLIAGQTLGIGEIPKVSTKGLKGLTKAKGILGNVGKGLIESAGGNAVLVGNTYGQSLQEAFQNGATDEEARKYALGSSATEMATEWITGGIPGIESTGFLDKGINKLIDKSTGKITNKLAKSISKTILQSGYEVAGEGLEEAISEIVSPMLKNATYSKGEEINWKDVFESAVVGGITGGILNTPGTISNFRENISKENSTKTTLPTPKNYQENNIVQEPQQNNNPSLPTPNVQVNTDNISNPLINNNQKIALPTPNDSNSFINTNNQIEQNASLGSLNDTNNRYEYIKDSNSKIDNLRRSASEYFNNSIESKSLIDTFEKVIKDKNYNIQFDNTLLTEEGNLINGQIRTLENGETEIRINPNSERAGEFILTHEITHSIETKEMVDLVLDYASKHNDFKESLNNLKSIYKTEDVSSEVLADISGQLFGNQEFINNLSTSKPSIFKRLYDSIISLANKLTGNTKESLFIKDLKNKWESAYRNNNNSLENAEYSLFKNSKKNTQTNLSEELTKDIENKTKSNFKNRSDVEFVSINDILPFKKNGGYRNKEQITELTNKIIANGIENPLEIEKNKNGTISIFNGNHRLEVANSLGLKEVPIKYNENENIENSSDSIYNENIKEFYNENSERENRNFSGIKESERSINKSRFGIRPSSDNSEQSKIERGVSRDGGLSNVLPKYNDGTSSNATLRENGSQKNSERERITKQGLDSSFSLNENSWQEHIEKNYTLKGTKTNFDNIRYNQKQDTENKLFSNKKEKIESKYEKAKKKTTNFMTKEASKILQFSDYKTKQNFKELISNYYENPDFNKIRKEIEENFSEQKIDYVDDYLKDIKRRIRTTKLKTTDYLKKNLVDYNQFKNSNFNKLKLSNEGQSIDSFYTEMTEDYPSIFSKDITNEVDQISRLSEFMNEDITITEKYKIDEKAINEATNYIYKSLKDKDNIDDLIDSISISHKEIRKEKTKEYREEARDFLENSSDWKDKKSGFAYKINTMKRNFYDVMGKKDASRLYSNYIEPIFNHNAAMQKDISNYNKKIEQLNLNNNESIAVQMMGELKYNPETLVTQMQVADFLEKNKIDSDKIESAVEVFRNNYDELIGRVNKTLKEQGFKEIDYRKGYFPHFTENKPNNLLAKGLEKIGWKFNDNSIPTSIAGITDQFKPNKVWTSFSQQRKGKFTDYNALKGFDNYIRGAMQTIYFSEDIQKLRALENEIRYQHSDTGIQARIDEVMEDRNLSYEDRQDKIDKIYANSINPLNNLVTELRDYTNGIANKKSGLDRTVEQLANRKFYNVMDNVSSRLSANMVGFNFGSAITNFIPITQAASQVKTKYLVKGLKEAIKNQYSADGFDNQSVFLTSRLNEAERLYKTKLDKFSSKLNFMFDGIDSITSNTIVRGKYYENIAKGMSKFNAMRNADEFARDLMAGRTKGEMPTAFNSKNPLVKMFTSFQLEVNNQYHYMFKDLPRDLEDEAKNKLVSGFIKMFVGAWIYNQLTDKLVGRKAAFSPADTIKEIYDTIQNKNLKVTDKTSNILENLTQDIPFIGGLIGGGRLPINSVANPISVLKGDSTVGKELKKLGYYTILPVGGGQLKKTIEGASMYLNKKDIKGSYSPKGNLRFEAGKDPISIGKALLFGQYSQKDAKNYIDSGYKSFDEKQQKEIKKFKIPLEKYREYQEDKKEISSIKSDKDKNGKSIHGTATAKKAHLIMNSSFSKKEKEYLLSKVNKDISIEELNKLDNNKETYKFYFSLSKKSRSDFSSELKNYDISSKQLINYYQTRKKYKEEYTSNYSKTKMMDYLQQSNLDEKTKWYLYNKDYGSENLNMIVNQFNIKSNDYFNVIKFSKQLELKLPGEKNSNKRKNEMFTYINNMKLNSNQKIVLFKQAGYSNKTTKNQIYSYINSLNKNSYEKKKLFEALY